MDTHPMRHARNDSQTTSSPSGSTCPDKSVNTITPRRARRAGRGAGRRWSETSRAGVIFASAKKHHFVAGADLFEIRKMDREQVTAIPRRRADAVPAHRDARRCPPSPRSTAIAWAAGWSWPWPARTRVAADGSARSTSACPEVKLGILPAWGGTIRLPRLIGLAKALPLLLAGKTLPPAEGDEGRDHR